MLPSTLSQLSLLLNPVSVQHFLVTVIFMGLGWALSTAFYNVYRHPLARFPGPRLAAASKFWLAYQEFVRGISLSDLRDELHVEYGALSSLRSPVRAEVMLTRSYRTRRNRPFATQLGALLRLIPIARHWIKSEESSSTLRTRTRTTRSTTRGTSGTRTQPYIARSTCTSLRPALLNTETQRFVATCSVRCSLGRLSSRCRT